MSTAALLLLDLVVAAAATASWLAAGTIAWPPARAVPGMTVASRAAKARVALLCAAGGIVTSAIHVALVVVLIGRGWWFAQEQAVLGMPLVAVTTIAAGVFAVPALVRLTRSPRPELTAKVPLLLLAAGVAGGVCVVSRVVIGYPMDVVAAAALLGLAALAVGLARALLIGSGRRTIAAFAGITVLVVVSWTGITWMTGVSPGGPAGHLHAAPLDPGPEAEAVSVTSLRAPAEVDGPVRRYALTAMSAQVELASGQVVDAWTYDGAIDGTPIRVRAGDVVEVTLANRDIAAGATIHWHGVDVPAGDDGVAGVTQDAVMPGESFRYRFVAEEAGTYWYHTHQVSADGVRRGLYGTLVVEPADGVPEELDLVVPMHTLGGRSVFGTSDVVESRRVEPGTSVRLRIVDTDDQPLRAQLDGAPFRVVAVDGRDLVGGAEVEGRSIRIPAGGRIDLSFTMPAGPVSLWRDGSAAVGLVLTPGDGSSPDAPAGTEDLDLLAYTSTGAGFPATGRRGEALMVLDRMPRFLGAAPAYGYTVNGAVAPHIPAIPVSAGEALTLTVVNRGWETHPMHVHGHHVHVVSRNGVPAEAALWLDTFDVQPGEVWVVELFADNPGIWMNHCHNLAHAAEGMALSLAYRGVSTPFRLGGENGNRPE